MKMGTFADARVCILLYWPGVAEQAPAIRDTWPNQSEKASDPMQCPSCGLDLGNTYAANCPRCGQSLTQNPPAGAYGAFGTAPTPPPTPGPSLEPALTTIHFDPDGRLTFTWLKGNDRTPTTERVSVPTIPR